MNTSGHIDVGEHRVRVTNLDKVLFPATNTTKGQVIDYYRRIAPVMLPLLRDRPVTRKRWVDGVGTAESPKGAFFTKQLESGAPEWIRRMPQEHSTGVKDYPLVDEEATLVWLAQMASIELHVPQWRAAHRGRPDRLVLDLDPGPGAGLAQCADVAQVARTILTGMGLDPVPVTSGSKGIHLYARLPVEPDGSGAYSSDEVSAVAKELATSISRDHPDLATAVMAKSEREGKVFIDWSQNNASKTTVSPYSLRGRSQPWVAAPRSWEELEDPDLRQLDYMEVLERASDPPGELAPYLAKRDPARTPEPMPHGTLPSTPRGLNRFVIQEHHARRLHYDLRIERDGVLESWAVPKGIPQASSKNHLAVMTEPHPMEYLGFSGTIPQGQYGAGTMTIWDSGTVRVEKWRDDQIVGVFTGQLGGPLGHTRLALIRTDGEGEKSSWLVHRMKEQPAPPAESAVRPVAPMLAVLGTRQRAEALGPHEWAEVKWDGMRAIGVWSEGALRLFSRNGIEITAQYPEVHAPILPARSALIDGEIVAFDPSGRPSFALLQTRMQLTDTHRITQEARRTPVVYEVFDLLMIDGTDLMARPLRERRELLEELAHDLTGAVQLPPVFNSVEEALGFSREHALEGVMVKDPESRYHPGTRSGAWIKLKDVQHQEAVIIGMRAGQGARAGTFGSLLLAVPDDSGGLRYGGRVGSGFNDETLTRLTALLTPLQVDGPAIEVPQSDSRDVTWVRPEVVGEVEFNEWTPSGRFRHPTWRGLRPDRSVSELTDE